MCNNTVDNSPRNVILMNRFEFVIELIFACLFDEKLFTTASVYLIANISDDRRSTLWWTKQEDGKR
jgi:hypothetical protein